MDTLWSETRWSTFKYFIILIVSTYYILCISWIIKCLNKFIYLFIYLLVHLFKIMSFGCVCVSQFIVVTLMTKYNVPFSTLNNRTW